MEVSMNSIANIIAAFFLSSLFVSVLIAGDSYYWSDGRKIKLIEDRSSLVLIYKEGSTYKNTEATHSRKKDVKSVTVSTDQKVTVVQLAAPKSSAILEVVKDFEIDERDLDWYSFGYRLETGASMRPTNRISFLLKTKYSLQDLERIVRNRATYDRTPYGTLMLRVIGPQVSVIDLANEVYESGIVEYCHPDFIAELVRYTDPLYPEQYYLNNTGQFGGTVNIDIDAPEAWDITLSSSQIKVAVIDKGGESHEDLNDQNGVSRVLTGYTPYNNGNGGPYGTGAGHGVACAGIIAASHNQLHVRGVAPNVKMLFVNIFWPGTTDQNIADGIGWAWRNGADVLSNSWGYGPGTYVDAVKKSIDSARTYGRNGKGSVVVFAAGNEGGAVAFPANVAGVIAVGAID
jgi:serine protease